jgi:hypothetical protein
MSSQSCCCLAQLLGWECRCSLLRKVDQGPTQACHHPAALPTQRICGMHAAAHNAMPHKIPIQSLEIEPSLQHEQFIADHVWRTSHTPQLPCQHPVGMVTPQLLATCIDRKWRQKTDHVIKSCYERCESLHGCV